MTDPKLPLSFLVNNNACLMFYRVHRFTQVNGHAPDEGSTLSEWLKTGPSSQDLEWLVYKVTDPEMLDIIARQEADGYKCHLQAVAYNKHTCPGTLEYLSDCWAVGVRAAVARHPDCPYQVIVKLRQDPEAYVRKAAGN